MVSDDRGRAPVSRPSRRKYVPSLQACKMLLLLLKGHVLVARVLQQPGAFARTIIKLRSGLKPLILSAQVMRLNLPFSSQSVRFDVRKVSALTGSKFMTSLIFAVSQIRYEQCYGSVQTEGFLIINGVKGIKITERVQQPVLGMARWMNSQRHALLTLRLMLHSYTHPVLRRGTCQLLSMKREAAIAVALREETAASTSLDNEICCRAIDGDIRWLIVMRVAACSVCWLWR